LSVRRAAKKDDNHQSVVQALRQLGAFVQDLGGVGQGCPDLLVGFRGAWHLLEVKDGDKAPSKRTLTPAEIEFVVGLRNRAPVHVVESETQAVRVVTGVER